MVSIIVPVYNVKNYLDNCLNSVVNQTLSDIEVIVVDDGSTDGSGEFLDLFEANNKSKVHVIHKSNGGLMSAWTLGVRESRGDYIGFVDSDDSVDLDMFEKMLNISLETDADIVLCDHRDSVSGKHYTSELNSGFYQGEEMVLIKSRVFPFPGNPVLSNARWNKLFKRHLIVDNLQYTQSLSRTFEDRYIVPAAIFSAQSFYYIKEPFYVYTMNRLGCNSKRYKPRLIDDVNRMYEIQKQVLLDKGLFDVYGQNWEKMYLDCIRVYVGRNILGVQGFFKRYESAKLLLSSAYFSERMERYGHLMQGKLGRAIVIAYKLHSSLLLAISSYLSKTEG